MRKFVQISFLSIISLHIACKKTEEKTINPLPTKVWVTARAGLYLREQPNTAAKIIKLIPYGQAAEIVSADKRPDAVKGFKADWREVKYNGISGWAFSAFLSPNIPAFGNQKRTKLYESACRNINNGAECCLAVEKAYLKATFQDRVVRNGDTLTINFPGSAPKSFNDKEAAFTKYCFIDVVDDIYVYEIFGFEGSHIFGYNAKTNQEYLLFGEPKVSPDGKRFLTFGECDFSGYCDRGLNVLPYSDLEIGEFRITDDSRYIVEASWMSPTKILILYTKGKNSTQKLQSYLELKDGVWQLY